MVCEPTWAPPLTLMYPLSVHCMVWAEAIWGAAHTHSARIPAFVIFKFNVS